MAYVFIAYAAGLLSGIIVVILTIYILRIHSKKQKRKDRHYREKYYDIDLDYYYSHDSNKDKNGEVVYLSEYIDKSR